MPPLRDSPRPPRRRCSAAVPALPLALTLAACAGAPSAPVAAAEPGEVLVELLPARAELRVDGRPVGQGGRVLPLPDPRRTYVLAASAPGYEPAERADTGAQLAGAHVVLALRPLGMSGADLAGALDPDDPFALASAAQALLRRGEGAAAREYASRAASLAPEAPAVRRVLDEIDGGRAAAATIEVRPGAGRAR